MARQEKKVGDYVWLGVSGVYKIRSAPDIFSNDRYATEVEVAAYKELFEN